MALFLPFCPLPNAVVEGEEGLRYRGSSVNQAEIGDQRESKGK